MQKPDASRKGGQVLGHFMGAREFVNAIQASVPRHRRASRDESESRARANGILGRPLQPIQRRRYVVIRTRGFHAADEEVLLDLRHI